MLRLPVDEARLQELVSAFGTPFHIYDEAGLLQTAADLNGVFDWTRGPNGERFRNYFAVKAAPNPYLLKVLATRGTGADASSLPELLLAEKCGMRGDQVMFTANNVDPAEYRKAFEMGAVINLDDINQIDTLMTATGGKAPQLISFRYNPGPDLVTDKSNVIGNPQDAKFGVTTAQLPHAYLRMKELGSTRFGLHAMVASNQPDESAHIETARILLAMAARLYREHGIRIEMINLGGGIGPQYRPVQRLVDFPKMRAGIQQKYQEIIVPAGLDPLRLVCENGRFVSAPNGWLITTVRSIKETYSRYVGVDATMADLMRPGMYNSYHHITVVGKENQPLEPQAVVGSLCENNDYFTGAETRLRELPRMEPGDIVVIHTTGAHGHAMGFNYNGKLRHQELLLRTDGKVLPIRRNETIEDLFATLDFSGLANFGPVKEEVAGAAR